jgi:hypothetical protein
MKVQLAFGKRPSMRRSLSKSIFGCLAVSVLNPVKIVKEVGFPAELL